MCYQFAGVSALHNAQSAVTTRTQRDNIEKEKHLSAWDLTSSRKKIDGFGAGCCGYILRFDQTVLFTFVDLDASL